jgi:hypothetical protein
LSLQHAISKVEENQEGLELNETHQLLEYVDDANILCENINTINEKREALTEASREAGLEGNTKKASIRLCLATKMQGKITVY